MPMRPDQPTPEPERGQRAKPFPWRCPGCGRREVKLAAVRYECRIKHDGRLHDVTVPELRVPRCGACQEILFDNDADELLSRALRTQLGLLMPEQIRSQR